MYQPSHRMTRRPGVILLIVVVMLALFVVIGLSFVLYAESAAAAARIHREAHSPADPAPSSAAMLSWALGQLVYGCPDDGRDPSGFGPQSAMRGHDLARSLYGWNWRPSNDPNRPLGPSNDFNNNTVPFNGSGFDQKQSSNNHVRFPNYQYFAADGRIADPERDFSSYRSGPNDANLKRYLYPSNVPYTYPDRNNMFLGAVDADGRVIVKSFHRDWLAFGSMTQSNPFWTSAPAAKNAVLRPRPLEMNYDISKPLDPHNFPLPAVDGYDVKNLVGAPGGNDSFWMDLGYPVTTTRAGRKYKPLFAFLVLDLDGRVNINIDGNGKGAGNTHASNQGLGKHEIDLSKIFTANPTEAAQVVLGRYGPDHQPGPSPAPGQQGLSYPQPKALGFRESYLFPLDFDGSNENAGGSPTTRFRLNAAGSYRVFPNFGTNGYGNFAGETTAHPLLYNLLAPSGGDQPYNIDNMFHLIGEYNSRARDYDKSTLYTTGLVRVNFESTNPGPTGLASLGARIRNLITTHSYDLGSPGASAWVTDASDPTYQYGLADQNVPFPTGQPYPPQSTPPGPPSLNGDFAGIPFPVNRPPLLSDADFRVPVLGKLDLNRRLASYFNIAGQFDQADPTKYQQALQDRQQFAQEIYERLLFATMGIRPGTSAASTPPTFGTPAYNARRWLAQLAVNIVDYIDDDDFITPFQWDLDPANSAMDPAKGFVYGTESAKLVINEAYAEIRNAPGDDQNPTFGAQQDFRVNFWLELFNTHSDSGQPDRNNNGQDRAAAVLQHGTTPVYRIQFVDESQYQPTKLQELTNVDGTLKLPPNGSDPQAAIKAQVTSYTGTAGVPGTDTNLVLPNDGAQAAQDGGNKGLYVLASDDDFESKSALTRTLKLATGMRYTVPKAVAVAPQPNITVLLQRLACPLLPEQPNPAQPLYNPYITVDYLTGLKVADAVKFGVNPNPLSPLQPRPQWTDQNSRKSTGRQQPYAGLQALREFQTGGNAPNHTFFKHNSNATAPFDWLVHLDRSVVSPLELQHVSAVAPHLLTQKFMGGLTPQDKFQHTAPWLPANINIPNVNPPTTRTPQVVQQARLYRALEYFTAGDRSFPAATGGRIPGMININTIWNMETFQALCAGAMSGANDDHFTDDHVKQLWQRILQVRSPGMLVQPPTAPQLGQSDQPFTTFAGAANADGTMENEKTLVRTHPSSQQLLLQTQGGIGQHPYLFNELMTKIASHVTTRSNVFAVYLTVGFFEVIDETTIPPKLGAEIPNVAGTSELARNFRRRRMFAIVDRTNIALDNPIDSNDTTFRLRQARVQPFHMSSRVSISAGSSIATIPVPAATACTNAQMTIQYEGNSFTLTPGVNNIVWVDTGVAQEKAFVFGFTPAPQQIPGVQDHTLQIRFFRPSNAHAAGFRISNVQLGNPGPQGPIDYNSPQYKPVVPFTYIIE